MFTGIVTATGSLVNVSGMQHTFATPIGWLAADSIGDSIAVNGVCLTISGIDGDYFSADLSAETKRCTVLITVGDVVNLEQALTVGDKLGGHFVTGHVDGVATIADVQKNTEGSVVWRLLPPPSLLPFIAEKGAITLAGVSLTVNRVDQDGFDVCLIPQTLAQTTFAALTKQSTVNIEVDIIARHIVHLQRVG